MTVRSGVSSQESGLPEISQDEGALRLREALRRARIEAADRSAVVVDLRDAEVARLEILNDALDPLFSEIPRGIDLFDRGISRGDTPRLWIDAVAHVVMGRDKRLYRFVQDTRFGRVMLAESHEVTAVVSAVTDYIARRIIEREQAMASLPLPGSAELAVGGSPATAGAAATTATQAAGAPVLKTITPSSRTEFVPLTRRGGWMFAFGFVAGAAALFALALLAALRSV